MTRSAGVRRWLATIVAGALAVSAIGAAGIAGAGAAAAAEPRTFALVGDLQSELGCPGDWQPECEATELVPTETAGVYAAEFTVPAGEWEYKVAVNDAWDESYGLNGGGDDIPLTVAGDTELRVVFDDTLKRIGLEGTDATLRGAYDEASDAALVADPVRQPGSDETFYFVMTDRFENGDPSNDTGGLTGDALTTGFDPTHKGFFQGGDLAGLRSQLDYIEGLGTTAIWLTPSFTNQPVQGEGADASAGYHGYWVTDFTQIDPHLGTNDELKSLIDDAHARGIKVYFDIITNHTADVIDYAEGEHAYIDQATSPYRDAAGTPFDPADFADADTGAEFPELDAATSFPYTPVLDPGEEHLKVPDWLNDPTLYHNRGDSTWEGESVTYGDFVGLDDLMTEHPTVVNGFVDVYEEWIDLGIDGFRIDTAKHVNFEFWEQWSAEVLDHAHSLGKDDFFMFGEVYDADPQKLSPYVRDTDMNSVLDFTFQSQAVSFASGNSAKNLQSLFAGDDYYTTSHSSATALPTFLGNHDMGRVGYFLQNTDAPLARDELAHDLLFLTRGQPVVYYGDEQGFAGVGGDQSARQTMFASQVDEYTGQTLVTGEPFGTGAHQGTNAPLYEHIAALSALRKAHPALATGAQIERYVDSGAGVYAFSRVDRSEKTEYLVAVNNADEPRTVAVPTLTDAGVFSPLYVDGGDGADAANVAVTADADGVASVTVPALGAVVYTADRPVSAPDAALAISVATPVAGAGVDGVTPVAADVDDDTWQETSFAWRVAGDESDDAWHALGTAEDTSPRVFHDTAGLADGTLVEYRAISTDAAGHRSAASTYASVGNAVNLVEGEEPEQPIELVTVPGNHNVAMGCAGDWAPGCEAAKLTLRADGVYAGTFDLPAGDYEYKVAINGSWDVNYGAGGVPGGPNIAYHHDGGPITFYWNPVTHVATSTAEGPILTVPGSFQSEIGCPGDWAPDCLASMLVDADGDGVYEFTTDAIPAGAYEAKVAHGMSWDENYGVGGVRDGSNYAFTTNDGEQVTFRYTLATHVLEIEVANPPLPGAGEQRAQWIDAGTIAWPAALLGGASADDATWTLEHAADAGLAVGDDGTVTGATGDPVPLTLAAGGLTEAQLARFPHLGGGAYLALQVEGVDRAAVQELLTEQLAVAQRSGEGSDDPDAPLTAFTGVQVPGVLDDLYADAVASVPLGITGDGDDVVATVWAPTAQSVALERWDAGATGDPELVEASFDAETGTWSTAPGALDVGDEYRWRVEVYAPSTGAIETNSVTDPSSTALTVNSTRTVVVDLDDPAIEPAQWADTPSPVIEHAVDRAIYELHVRDFSITDETVPEAERGTYRAFTRDSAGTQQLRQLADAGINTVHLLPTFDIATIEERRDAQARPDCDLASYGPASTEQQACLESIRDLDGFNWGYDPFHFQAPEGSYAVDPDGAARVGEFREMVGALHGMGLQVVLDEVYNHTSASGQSETSVLDRVVPGYYQRLNAAGAVETSTCCQNVATEHAVAQKLMVDSVVLWAKEYKVDGFRFDLMGHHSRDNMLAVRAALDELTLEKDGVDGSAVYLYGEGWNFGEVADNARFEQATQGQLGGTGIGTFNDRLRDGVHGGSPVDASSTYDQGFGTGLADDPNGHPVRDGTRTIGQQTDLVKLGLAGNLRAFEFEASDGTVKRGDEIDYNGQPAGYADQPDEVITYVDAHDNETLFDHGIWKLPTDTSMADRVRMNTLSLATVAFAQTPAFWHAGTELLRSKSLDRNSYNSGDWFNRIDWTGQESTFGSGLPPEADNGAKWADMAPLLSNPALKPTAADIASAEASALDLLKVRSSVDLLQLGSAELIEQKVSFPNSGADATPGLIAMLIDDTIGEDADADLDGALVVFNASTQPITEAIEGLAGRDFALNEVQANGADAVTASTSWDAATGTVTIPARTAVVLVDEEPPPAVGTLTIAAPNHLLAKAQASIKVSGQVFAFDGSRPVGEVTVSVDGRVVGTEQLVAADRGRFSVKLPKLTKGIHLVRVVFTGGPGYASSRTLPVPILLW